MIFESLTINNFTAFAGKHKIDLKPRENGYKSPAIILFGGLNGAGKTSILTAIRFALLGRIAFGKGTSGKAFEEQLGQFINKRQLANNEETEASIILTLNYIQAGVTYHLQITRSWRFGEKDKLDLVQNGEPLTNHDYGQSQAFLFQLVPSGVADLFFFDGEKIANLAEDTSGNLLKQAVWRLLGLDLIARLKEDIGIYLKQQVGLMASKKVKDEIETLDNEYRRLETKIIECEENLDEMECLLKDVNKEIGETEERLQSHGGEWAKSREEAKSKRDELIQEQAGLQQQLLTELDGYFPMALAPKTMTLILEQLEAESKKREKQAFKRQLESYFFTLNKDFQYHIPTVAQIAFKVVKQSLVKYMGEPSDNDILLDLSLREHHSVELQAKELALQSQKRFQTAKDKLGSVSGELIQTSDHISRAIESDRLNDLIKRLRELDKEKVESVAEYRRCVDEARRYTQERLEVARKLQSLHKKERDVLTQDRSFQLAEVTQIMLEKLTQELINVRVTQLEKEFSNAYKRLARKEDLLIDARINPETFDVELIDEQGHVINRKALSAGEKQIYAIAILDALGKVSEKHLPVVIDTPLGRLDSKHRDKLVEHYFPEASEQVIILSTDTEVDERFFELLEDDISHAFEISFNEQTKCSELKEGYFWEKQYKEAV